MNVSLPPSPGSSVVIACATADVELIAKVGERLRERGYGVELLGGAEADELALAAAVERVGRQGLYVLVRSAELGRAAVDALRARLRRSDVSFGRILTLTLDGVSSPSVLEDRILSVLQRLSSWTKAIGAVVEGETSLPPPARPTAPAPVVARPAAASASPASEDDAEDLESWAESLAGRLVAEAIESEPSGTTSLDAGTGDASLSHRAADTEQEPRLDVERLVEDEDEDDDDEDDAQDEPVQRRRPPSASTSQTSLRPPVPPPLRPKGLAASASTPGTRPGPAPMHPVANTSPARPVANTTLATEPALADTLVADLLGHEASAEVEGPSPTPSPLAFASVASVMRPDETPGEASASTDLRTLLEAVRQREGTAKPTTVARSPSTVPETILPAPENTSSSSLASAARPLVPRETPLETAASPLRASVDEPVADGDASSSNDALGKWQGRGAWSSVQSWTSTLRTKGEQVLVLFKDAVPESPRTLLERDWWREHRAAIGMGLAAVFVLGLGLSALGDDEDERSPAAIASAGTVPPEVSTASAVPTSPPPNTPDPSPPAGEEMAVLEVEEPSREPRGGTPHPAPTPTVQAGSDAAAVVSALERRRVRAMDTLLVTADAKAKLTYGDAERYCQELEVAGIGAWRVPTIGELLSLGQAKIVARGSYWSATPGDAFGDRVMVFHATKADIAPVSTQARSPSTVCVRTRG